MFVGVRIENHARAGAETFDLAHVMLAKLAPLIQSARVCEDMSPACSIGMKVNRLLSHEAVSSAERTQRDLKVDLKVAI